MSFVEYVLLPASALKNHGKPKFVVPRRDAEPLEYTDIAKMKEDYLADILQPQSLKPAATDALLEILSPIRKAFESSTEWQAVEQKAYPPPPAPAKKPKKEKNLGSRFPGNKPVAKPDGSIEGPGAHEASVGTSTAEAVSKLSVQEGGGAA